MTLDIYSRIKIAQPLEDKSILIHYNILVTLRSISALNKLSLLMVELFTPDIY